MDEIRLAGRRLARRPGATIASVLTLAASIGAAAATWSLLSAVLINPLPVADPGRLVVVGEQQPGGPLRNGHDYPLYRHIRDSGIFEQVAAEWSPALQLPVSSGGAPTHRPVAFVSHDYFDVLGIPVPLGRGPGAEDDRRGAHPVAVLSERYWQESFDGLPGIVGGTITVAGRPVTVVGVAPRRFRGLSLAAAPDLFIPLHTIADLGPEATNYFADPGHGSSPTAGVSIIGRIEPGATAAHVVDRLRSLPPVPGPRGSAGLSLGITPIDIAAVPAAARPAMSQFSRLLAATVGLLLLIGCGTVGMLLVVRTEGRRVEIATCLALGASRARLARGIGAEGALLAGAGALLALPVAQWIFAGVRAFQLPGGVAVSLLELTLDARAIAAAMAAALAGTLFITLLAAASGISTEISGSLRARAGGTPRQARRRTRAALVAGQVAVALVLVSGAGLFARSLAAALSLNPGFDAGNVVVGTVSLRPYGYTDDRAAAFFDELRERLTGNPAIDRLAYSVSQGGMTSFGTLVVNGEPRRFPSTVWFDAVDEEYFDAMRLRPAAGRVFHSDDRDTSPRVAVVSESFGRMLAGGGTSIGSRITMPQSRRDRPPEVMEIVGVVPDIVTNVAVLEPLALYLPLAQHPGGASRDLTVRAAVDPDAARGEVLAAIRQIDRDVSASLMPTMEERIDRQMHAQRFGATVLGALGGIAVLLMVLGTYVLGESMAVMRMREMGIRAALGASRRQLAAIVLAETGRLVVAGLAAGLLLAWTGGNAIRAFLFGVRPFDPVTIGGVAGLILTLALFVSVRPALRAARVDPGALLREE